MPDVVDEDGDDHAHPDVEDSVERGVGSEEEAEGLADQEEGGDVVFEGGGVLAEGAGEGGDEGLDAVEDHEDDQERGQS